MPALERLLGDSPRTKVAEALLRLGDLKVNRAEIARESGLFRTSTNRVLSHFETEGIVRRIEDGKRPLFQANLESPYLLLLARFAAAVELVNLTQAEGSMAPASAHAAAADFASAIRRVTSTVSSGVGSALIPTPNPGSQVRKVLTA